MFVLSQNVTGNLNIQPTQPKVGLWCTASVSGFSVVSHFFKMYFFILFFKNTLGTNKMTQTLIIL